MRDDGGAGLRRRHALAGATEAPGRERCGTAVRLVSMTDVLGRMKDAASRDLWAAPESRSWVWVVAVCVSLIGLQALTAVAGRAFAYWRAAEQGVEHPDMAYFFGDAPSVVVMLALAGLFVPVSVFLYRWLARVLQKRECFELSSRGSLSELAWGLLVGAVLVSVPVLVLWAAGCYQVKGLMLGPGVWGGLYTGLAAAFFEEMMMRGLLLRGVEKSCGTVGALVISCAVFGALHLGNSEITVGGVVAIGVEAGLLLGVAYLYTRRLWFPIGIHLAWNCVQCTAWSSPVSGTGTMKGLLDAEFTGPGWLTGGTTGIEGSVVTVLVCLAASALMGYQVWKEKGYLSWRPGRLVEPASAPAPASAAKAH